MNQKKEIRIKGKHENKLSPPLSSLTWNVSKDDE